jgi:hypothetical protein
MGRFWLQDAIGSLFWLPLSAQLTFSPLDPILCHMLPAVYLTDPEEMRKARLNQPRVSSTQARRQRVLLRRASKAA